VPVATLLVAGCTLTACGTDEKDPNIVKAQAYAAECTKNLANGDYAAAQNAGENVIKQNALLALSDDDGGGDARDQAVFCYTTSRTLYKINEITKNIQSQLGLVMDLVGGSGVSIAPQDLQKNLQKLALDYTQGRLDPQAAGAIGLFLDAYLGPVQSLLEENEDLLRMIIKRKKFNWYAQQLPVKIADKELINAGGRYDMGEIYLIFGLTRAMLGTIYVVESQDYTISLAIANYALNVKVGPNGQLDPVAGTNPLLELFNGHIGRGITNAVAVLMSTSPSFLALDKTAGLDFMKKAGEGFADGFGSIGKSIVAMKGRPAAEQAKHIIEFKTEDDKNYFVMHMKFNNLIPLVDLRKFDGISIPLSKDIIDSFDNLAKDFGGAQGVNTNLQRDIFPVIALVAVVIINSGAFQAIIDLAVESSDQSTKDMINQALGLVADNPDFILAALVGVVPITIEFDFGHIFKAPVGLREVFPAWVQPNVNVGNDAESLAPFTTATIVYSYECADGKDALADDTFLCGKDNIQDGPHFHALDGSKYVYWDPATTSVTWVHPLAKWENQPTNNFGTKWADQIPADEVPTGIPYFGWKDASFGDLVYLDVTPINTNGAITAGNGLKKADQQSLNATIAYIVSQVESLF
jgi:hypothetical protein